MFIENKEMESNIFVTRGVTVIQLCADIYYFKNGWLSKHTSYSELGDAMKEFEIFRAIHFKKFHGKGMDCPTCEDAF